MNVFGYGILECHVSVQLDSEDDGTWDFYVTF